VAEKRSNLVENSSDREIFLTRVFDAPRDLVWSAWTEPRHLIHWWGPKGFTNTFQEINVKPGGVWRFIMHGPDGRDYQNKIIFDEVVKPERLVYSHNGDEGEPVRFQTTVTFAERGDKTELTMRMVFPSTAERDRVVKEYHAIEGANQTLDRLADHVAKLSGAKPATGDILITRILDAPRELVFKVWTDPKHVAQWWGPGGFTNPVCELDLRPGGAIRIHMRAPNGSVHPMTGVYQEILEPEKLVFTSAALDEDGTPLFEILNTVTFAEQGRKTKLTLHATVIKTTAQAAPYLVGAEMGWTQSLQRLAEYTLGIARTPA
jgi:uncharacterized protein YndB with AHSA1/START domain